MKSTGGLALVAGGLAFAASAVVFGATVADVVRIGGPGGPTSDLSGTVPGDSSATSPARSPAPESPRTEDLPRTSGYPRVSQDEILTAVNQDLFQPDRMPPLERYVLPSRRPDLDAASRDDRRRREPNLRIVGTAIFGDRALALVQLEDSIPFAVLMGEEVDGYRLAAVDAEGATLTGENGEFTLPVVEPDRRGGSRGRDRNARADAERAQETARALSERVQRMLQEMGRGRTGGGGLAPGVEIPIQLQELLRAGRLQLNTAVRTRTGGRGGGNLR